MHVFPTQANGILRGFGLNFKVKYTSTLVTSVPSEELTVGSKAPEDWSVDHETIL